MKMTDDDYLCVYRAWSGSPAHHGDERQAAIGVVSAAVGGDLDRATAVMVRHGWGGVQLEDITDSTQAEPLYADLRATACRLGYPVAGEDTTGTAADDERRRDAEVIGAASAGPWLVEPTGTYDDADLRRATEREPMIGHHRGMFDRLADAAFCARARTRWPAAVADANALRDENARLRLALADAIRRPMGVVPASAEGLVTDADLVAAESRRVTAGHATRGS